MATILEFNGKRPQIHPSVFLAPTAVIIGDVTIGEDSSVWFGAVLRGDDPTHGVVVGPRTSVQENCVVHVGRWGPTVIGMNAIILQNAVVGEECVLAANTVVLEKAEIPARSVVAGVPGKVKKTLEGSAAEWIKGGGEHYVQLSREYLRQGIGTGDPDAGGSNG